MPAPRVRMGPCPSSPNCVSALAPRDDTQHFLEPVPLAGASAETAVGAVVAALEQLPRTRIVERDGGYIHAEVRSRLFRFVDDVELQVDTTQGRIDHRSGARLGHSDMGVNRKRMEALTADIAARLAAGG